MKADTIRLYWIVIIPERYARRFPLGMYSKQSNLSDFSAQMYFPLYSTYIFSVSEHQPTSSTTFGCLSLIRWLASFSNCLSLTPGIDELSFFTAILSPFCSTPCFNSLVSTCMSLCIVWWHMLASLKYVIQSYFIYRAKTTLTKYIREVVCDVSQILEWYIVWFWTSTL